MDAWQTYRDKVYVVDVGTTQGPSWTTLVRPAELPERRLVDDEDCSVRRGLLEEATTPSPDGVAHAR